MKHEAQNKRRAYIVRLCLVYLMLVLFVCVPPTLSRYHSLAEGSSSAQVAAFNWHYEITSAKAGADGAMAAYNFYTTTGIKPGWSDTITVTIQNTSQVTCEYTLSVVNETGNLPLDFTPSSASGVLAQGESKTVTVAVLWPLGENSASLAEKLDAISLNLIYQQVD